MEEEFQLRGYSKKTESTYTTIISRFIKSATTPREFLLQYKDKRRSTMRTVYFALKFYYEHVLHQEYKEGIPLANAHKILPVVLSKDEIHRMITSTENKKHQSIIQWLYYSGLRLDELINLRIGDIDFDRRIIHVKKEKCIIRHNLIDAQVTLPSMLLREYGIYNTFACAKARSHNQALCPIDARVTLPSLVGSNRAHACGSPTLAAQKLINLN